MDSQITTSPLVGHIARLTLNVHDLKRAMAFYVGALGFRVEAQTADHARLALGSQRIELFRRPDAVAYPEPRAANDPWFQHFAIAVADMDIAYERLSRFAPEPITRGGPQLLPPSTGSVTAFKFRDPDGHPLELFHAPGSRWSRDAAAHSATPNSAMFLGIDHTAIAVRALDVSIAFYTGLGFRSGDRSLNQGPAQARLDGLDDPVVDIVTLTTADAGPHIELLHYRSPASAASREVAPGAVAATQMVLATVGIAAQYDSASPTDSQRRDPDGHLLRFTTS